MATELLAVGTTAADSGDLVVSAGTPVTVSLKDAAGPVVAAGANVLIQLKDDDGQYFTVGTLSSPEKGRIATVIYGPGTYRFSRLAGTSCGVFSG